MTAKKVFSIISGIINWLLLGAMVILVAAMLITKLNGGEPQLFGYRLFVIATGSMSPTLEVNDLILTKEFNPGDELAEGDILTYEGSGDMSGYLITHRLMSVSSDENGRVLILKGDYNNVADSPIAESRVVAKYVCTLHILGFLFRLINSKYGMPFVILIIAGFIVFEALQLKKNGDTKNNKEND